LLTGRNHTFVANGQIAELANDWDGFTGTIPKSAVSVAEVLKAYGYNTGAWGKWHNTPAEQTTSKGPFDNWPTGLGFEYFYGFLAGEASQWEPTMVRNTTIVNPHELHRKGYHLTGDIAEDAIRWLREQQAFSPDKPFFMYWAPGSAHGPHHIFKEWADKYKGKFDDGWDKYRERAFAPPETARLDSVKRPTYASTRHIGLMGVDPRVREAVPAPSYGGIRRLRRARRLKRGARHRDGCVVAQVNGRIDYAGLDLQEAS
jgi:arylsulfatase A-like enzyme